MDEEIRHLFPITVEVQQGKTYLWCSCGKSEHQPFCDREECKEQALPYVADLTEDLCFCACKHTKNTPFCDGSHGQLLLDYVKQRQIDSKYKKK